MEFVIDMLKSPTLEFLLYDVMLLYDTVMLLLCHCMTIINDFQKNSHFGEFKKILSVVISKLKVTSSSKQFYQLD